MDEQTPKRKERPHIEVNKLDEKKKKSMLNRILVGLGLIVVAVPASVLGGWLWFAFITFFLAWAVYEILKAPQKKYRWYIWVATYAIVFSYVYWFLIKFNGIAYAEYKDRLQIDPTATFTFQLESYFRYLDISVYGMAVAFAVYCLGAILHEDFVWSDVLYFFTMTFFLGLGFQALLFIRYYPFSLPWEGIDKTAGAFRFGGSVVFLFYVVLTTYLNDIFAYFVGVLFGKHPINPRISPNKTWEGFIGGIVLGGVAGLGFALIMDACGYPILPGFAVLGKPQGLIWLLPLSLTIPLVANLGDFAFSTIKRFYGFKDYSHLLGAHGGVLDRVDSLTFTSIYASIFAVFSAAGWNFFA